MTSRFKRLTTHASDASRPSMRSGHYGFGKAQSVGGRGAVLLALTFSTGAPAQAQEIIQISESADARAASNSFDAPQASVEIPGTSEPSGNMSVVLGSTVWGGDFGSSSDTTITAIATTIRYQAGDLRISAQMPWMRIRSAGTVFTGIGGTPLLVAPSVPTPRRIRRGIGDLTIGADYVLAREDRLPFTLELNGRVKLPTAADSSGLSTGKIDYSLGAEVSRSVGSVIPAVSASYRVFGDPVGWNLRNGLEVATSVTVPVARIGAVYAAYTYTEAASRMIADGQEITVGLSMPVFEERVRLTAIGGAGLSRGTADLMAGAAITIPF